MLAWFVGHRRPLPTRDLTDPYAIWICEAMSQQTQIARVATALPAFLRRFPTLDSLAHATPGAVIRAWAGMGYNRRALQLCQAARVIVEQHGGRLPDEVALLATLPGIGPYTARAIAAFAFGARVTALDVNAGRVLGRVLTGHGRAGDPGRPERAGTLQVVADALAPAGRAADWNHALMDLGATVCRVRPDCAACPVRGWCRYAASSCTTAPAPAPPRLRAAGRADPGAARRRLRGRIVSELRRVPSDRWHVLQAEGGQTADELADALAALERDGLIERDARGAARLAM